MRTIGIGGSTAEAELAKIIPKAHLAQPIQDYEFRARIQNALKFMKSEDVQAVYLHAGTNLFYFSGTKWNSSERMVGALLFSDGELQYIAPEFERGTIEDFMRIEGVIYGWEEHESPYLLFVNLLLKKGISAGRIALDESTPFFVSNGIQKLTNAYQFVDAKPITAGCRMIKSEAEIAIMQVAMDITLEVLQAAARILYVGISTDEVTAFINEAHKRYGAPSGSYFCIVLFGVDSSFPHGVKSPNNLEMNDMVLMDTGCKIHDYISDITRSYVFGEASDLQRQIWEIEKNTQYAAFDAAQLGEACASIDKASRRYLESQGLGPDYKLPGLPHRTGHGLGLDIHEWPFIVQNESTILEPGMCFSIEPMICIPNLFGIRLEDHVYMTNTGARWFTQPAKSIEDPFGVI